MREIELKFELAPEDADRLARSQAFGKAHPKRRTLHAIYYDTADHRLAAHGMALRVRREGRRWVQCLKAGRSGEGGLHARDEWEWPRPDGSLDTSLLADSPFAAVPRNRRAKLAPVFEVEMERTAWALDLGGGNRVEVALDRGEARRGRKRSPICELQIESLEGDAMAVFAAADRLLREVPMRPSTVTKAQRGYALSRPRRAAPAKAVRVTLDPAATLHEATRRIVAAALAQLQGNDGRAAGTGGDEYLHQFRVGLRRLRSALRIFDDAFTRGQARGIRADCRWLSRGTGEARDWDVFAACLLPELLREVPARSRRPLATRTQAARTRARKRVQVVLSSKRYARFLLRLARWLAAPDAQGPAVRGIAIDALDREDRKARRALRRLDAMDAAERHALRIRLKRLRYACESVESLFPGASVRRYVKALARLQHDLGDAADARAGMRLLEKLRLADAVSGTARSRLEAMEAASLRELRPHVEALRGAVPFWRADGD